MGVWTVPTSAMVVVICFIMGGLTEVTSNVASANILLPIMAEVAWATEVRSEEHSPRIMTHNLLLARLTPCTFIPSIQFLSQDLDCFRRRNNEA